MNLSNFVTHLGFSKFIKVVALVTIMVNLEEASASFPDASQRSAVGKAAEKTF